MMHTAEVAAACCSSADALGFSQESDVHLPAIDIRGAKTQSSPLRLSLARVDQIRSPTRRLSGDVLDAPTAAVYCRRE